MAIERNILVEFEHLSYDFLKLLGRKSAQAKTNLTVANEISEMEIFYTSCQHLIREYDKIAHALKIENVTLTTKYKILLSEFEDEFKKKFGEKPKPSEKQWMQIKQRYNNKTPLGDILNHFQLSKNQIIELVDA